MDVSLHVRRFVLGAGLALAALAPAALAGSARAAEPLTLSPLEVRSAGTYAVVAFTSSEPALVSADYKPATAAATAGLVGQPSDLISSGIVGPILPREAHELKLTGLTSNTAYVVTVTARTGDNRTATAFARFTTAKKRIRVTLASIDVKDDGDLFGKGEATWGVTLNWDGGFVGGCYPFTCTDQVGVGEGRFTPLNSTGRALQFVLAEENFDRFPDAISLRAYGDELDSELVYNFGLARLAHCVSDGGCLVGDNDSPAVWSVPQGVESADQTLTLYADDTDTGFRSVLTFHVELVHHDVPYPTTKRNTAYSTWK